MILVIFLQASAHRAIYKSEDFRFHLISEEYASTPLGHKESLDSNTRRQLKRTYASSSLSHFGQASLRHVELPNVEVMFRVPVQEFCKRQGCLGQYLLLEYLHVCDKVRQAFECKAPEN